MSPQLKPGDFVLVAPKAFEHQQPQIGDVVVAHHPYQPRIIIKRVSEVSKEGVMVLGDHAKASSDSRVFGHIQHSALLGRVTCRIS